MNRRTFLGQTAIAGAAFTVVPRHVLGGPGQTPPSEKITVALIGCGYQGHLELPGLLAEPQVQMAAVCDPNRESADYVDWGRDGLRRSLAAALGKPDWRAGTAGCLGGREVAREYIELYYGARRPAGSFKGVAVYTDFRELLAREKGIDLWLGPSQPRAYHPHYTHAVFRGWYEFGGGPVADMGHYSLWRVFREFGLDAPVSVESTPSHVCEIVENVSRVIRNDYSFPAASTIRFKFAAKGPRPALDLFWYDGGMKPATPEEVEQDNQELAAEGMLFVGDQGKINLVVVMRDRDAASSLLAVDLRTGKTAWETARPDSFGSFGTPILWKNSGVDEVVVAGPLRLKGYALATGKENWVVDGITACACTTPVEGNGMLYFAAWSDGKADDRSGR